MGDFLRAEGVGALGKESNHTAPMNYIGIDIHKKYCVLSALNEAGERAQICLLYTSPSPRD